MNQFFSLIKMNCKLLLRNKMFLFFLCITPIISMMILGLKGDNAISYQPDDKKSFIMELQEASDKAVYHGDYFAFRIKVYDGAGSELSEYVLEQLAKTGMFSICRADVSDKTEEEILQIARQDAFGDRAGILLYFKPAFDEKVLSGKLEEALIVFPVSEEERVELFQTELGSLLSQIEQVGEATGAEAGELCELLWEIDEKLPQKNVHMLKGKDTVVLSSKQATHKDLIGYSFAIITLGFLFCGVCVSHTVIEEQENKAYTRIMLSGIGNGIYLAAKLCMAVVISLLQTVILGIAIWVRGDIDFGISKLTFLAIIFLLGLIFAVLSFYVGVVFGNVMGANYAVFTIWSISALLAGLYFPLDFTKPALKALSYLMPQRWFMRACELLLTGDSSAYSMVLCTTAAYLIVMMSLGGIGLKMKSPEA